IMTPKGGIQPHKRFSVQSNRSEVLFVDYMAEHLTINGRAGIIVPEGIIFQSAGAYKQLRKYLIENNYLYAVVSLPAGVFNPYSGVKTSILFLDRELAKKTNNILFIKVEADGLDLGAQRREIEKNDLPEVLKTLKNYKIVLQSNKEFSIENENVLLVEINKIKEKDDYNLSIDRYRENGKAKQSHFEMVRLGDIAEVISGQSPESEFYNDKKNGMPFYQGRTEFGDIFIGEPKTWTTKITKIALKNDILMSVRAPVGPVNIATQEICIGRGLASIRPKERILLRFLFTYLQSIQGNIKGNGGAVFDSINRDQIMDLQIPLPPIEIQQQIVSRIEKYQAIINGAKQVVDNYKPEIEIREDWEMVELGSVCEITSSKRIFQEEYVNSGVPFYRTKEIVELSNEKEISLEIFISKERYTELKSKFDIPKKGELLISAVGTIGIIWVIPDDREFYFKDGNLIWIKELKNIDPIFLKLVLENELASKFKELTNGVAYNALTIIKLKQLQIPFPALSEQNDIISKIEQEQALVNGNKKLISFYEQKIKDEINKLWMSSS
ncbi:MAG: restriction endonuclease subunit S, partial [Bacteroidia bacterium]